MADAYGYFLLNKSDDCVLDEKKLIKKLNKYRWNSSHDLWEINAKNGRITTENLEVQYATVFPSRITKVEYENLNGVAIELTIEEFLELEDQNFLFSVTDDYEPELEEICKDIAIAISKGWIEISYISMIPSRERSFGALQINESGQGKRTRTFSGYEQAHSIIIEHTEKYFD